MLQLSNIGLRPPSILKWMTQKTAAATIALDYAVAQRILPKIIGNGEEFEKWLNEFGSLCSSNGLNTSARMVKNIIERGNHQMKYYQFFC